jgi:hypothetical protein
MTRVLSRLFAPTLSLLAFVFFHGVEPEAGSSGDTGSILEPDGRP